MDLVMPMYNLIKYSSNYFETAGRLWFYLKEEAIIFDVDIADNNNFKYFEHKNKLLGNTVADGAQGILRNLAIVVP